MGASKNFLEGSFSRFPYAPGMVVDTFFVKMYTYNMKRKVFFLFWMITLLSSAAFAKENVMTVETQNCSVSVPEKWSVINSYQMVPGQLILCLMAPQKEGEVFQSNLNVTVQEVEGKISEKEILKQGVKELGAMFPNFKILEEGKNYHIYTATINGMNLKQVQFAKVKGKKVYILTGTGSEKTFDSYYADFKDIFKTFKPVTSSLKEGQIRLTAKDCSLTLESEWYVQFLNDKSIFNLYSPVNSKSGYRSNLALAKDVLTTEYSVEEYLELSESVFGGIVQNYEVLERGKNFHVYNAVNGNGLKVKEVQFVKAKDKKTFFVLTCTALEEDYDSCVDAFSAVADSLTIK